MSEKSEYETAATGESEFSQTDTEAGVGTPPKAKSSGTKVVVISVLVGLVLVVGFYTWRILNKPAPQARPAATAPVTTPATTNPAPTATAPTVAPPAVEPPVDPLAAVVTPPAADPLAVAPVASAVPASPSVGPDGQPVVTAPAAPAATPAPVGVNPAVAPAAGVPASTPGVTPAATGAVPSNSADPLAALAPTSVPAPVAPTASPAAVPAVATSSPAVATIPTSLGDDLASKVGAAVTDAIRPMQTQLNNIDQRVTRLEGGRPAVTPARSEGAVKPRAPARRPVAKAKPRAVPAAAPANRIEVLDAASTPVTPRPVSPAAVARSVPSASVPASAGSIAQQKTECNVGAVLQGRAWVKKNDGSFETYGVGDTLPDGKVVSGISPERGIQVGGQAWKCQ